MDNTLQQFIRNYGERELLKKQVYVRAIKNGEEVFDGLFEINATIETNYSQIKIMWDEDHILPGQYQEHYPKNLNRFPVDFKYYEMSDKLFLSGNFDGVPYTIEIHVPN